jgi:hypothetical protein
MRPPHTPTPTFISAFSRLYSTAYTICSVTGCLPGKRKFVEISFCDLHAQSVRKRVTRAVALVRHHDRRLQHESSGPIHVKLAPREPAEIPGICGIEEKQRRLAVRSGQLDGYRAVGLLQSVLEARLLGDVAEKLGV